MRRGLWCCFLMFLLSVGVRSAEAAPIVVSAGDTVTFNFDFVASGAVPPPPYDLVEFYTGIDSLDPEDVGTWTFYDGLDATGTILLGPFDSLWHLSSGDLGDGLFSVVLNVTGGSFSVDPFAVGADFFNPLTGIIFPLQATAVPEPATLTLLGLGLAGAGVRRWRQRTRT